MTNQSLTVGLSHTRKWSDALRTEPVQPDMDLRPDIDYRVRLYRHGDPQPTVIYEGLSRFTINAIQPVRVHGRAWKRWLLTVNCLPGGIAVCGAPPLTVYRPGDGSIEFGERHILYLLDRGDPERPFGSDGPSGVEVLWMALETFAIEHGITYIRFE